MKHFLFYLLCTLCMVQIALAQPATVSIPLSIGRENCGNTGGATQLYRFGTGSGTGGTLAYSYDSLFFFNYAAANLGRSTVNNAMFPRLRIGTSTYSGRISGVTLTQMDRFTTAAATVSFNPKDGMIYYLWTDYFAYASATLKTYVWRWKPDTTFASSLLVPYRPAPLPINLLDTFKSFAYDIGGVAFDNTGKGWVLEFSSGPAPFKAYLRQMDFSAGTINAADTLSLVPIAGGIGDTIYNVNSGDITLTPSGQMYFVFDNKLYTPDYGSYGNPTHKIDATCLDTLRTKPTGSTNFVGLGFADGDLLGAYSTGCYYGKLDPVSGTPSAITYTYTGAKGVASSDLAQINSGVGVAKKLASATPTGTAGQYDVVYDVYVKNYGNVPINNLQVTDNLAAINGSGNLSNVSTTMMTIPPPPGIALNTGFNGVSNINLLVSTGQNLPNYPTDSSTFVIRINCRISNVVDGVVYYNSAVATATGFKNVALRDSSTNGDVPDLNQNDKPDDVSEGIPTPFLIALKPTPSPCGALTSTLYAENFGTGSGLSSTLPTTPNTFSTTYAGSATQPIAKNTFTLTDNAKSIDTANFNILTDHTGGGKMMAFNADAPPRILFRDTMPTSCPGRQYSLSYWTAFPTNTNYFNRCDALGGFRYPQFIVRMRDITTGLTVVEYKTDSITNTTWQQRGMRWTMPVGYSNLILEIENAGPGGCGNDVMLDDIVYGSCDALPVVNTSAVSGCIGVDATFTGSLADSAVLPGPKQHQWQVASAIGGPYVDIPGATSPTYVISPVAAADTGKYYRLCVAAFGSITIPICRSSSSGIKLIGAAPSAPAASATRSKNNICPGISVNLGITGGTLGTNANWKWYSGASCGTTLAGTGATISVTPTSTTTYYVRAEGDCNTTSCQQVTVFISCDLDKDKDGIPDYVESNIAVAAANAFNTGYSGYIDINNDFVNDNFQADGDSDNDLLANYLDPTFPGRVDVNGDNVDDRFDIDLDGIINMLDLDSDNDGVPDVVEAYGVDANGDGRLDNFTDTDGDGLSQNVDANNTGANNTGNGLALPDLDADGIPNFLDLDSDNDGIPDIVEAGGTDANNNGKVDGFTDANLDGLHDGYINATALIITGADVTADGRADSYPNKNLDRDLRPNAYDMDSDGDGIVDAIEAGGGIVDANFDGRADGVIGVNGWSASVSALVALNLRNTEGIGNPDYLDIDSDGDGIPDNIEGQPTPTGGGPGGYQFPTTTDADGDGLMLPYDNVPAAFGGAGILLYDHDGDGTPDYRDLDTDGDGRNDIIEGNDFNLNGLTDDNVTPTGVDTDGDGLDNRFDSLNSVTNIKGTSYMMGTNGSTVGDATPGTRSPVQKRTVGQIDRDWRYSSVVLPVQFLNFSGALQSVQVQLVWAIITNAEVDRFEIERSTDNATFAKTGTVTGTAILQLQQNFGYSDDVTNLNSATIYYRLKVIGKGGEVKYSNVLVVRQSATKTPVSIMPNPANDYVTIKFVADKQTTVTIRLINDIGSTVLQHNQQALKGNNSIQLNNLNKYSKGVYTLQLLVNDEVVSQNLILNR